MCLYAACSSVGGRYIQSRVFRYVARGQCESTEMEKKIEVPLQGT